MNSKLVLVSLQNLVGNAHLLRREAVSTISFTLHVYLGHLDGLPPKLDKLGGDGQTNGFGQESERRGNFCLRSTRFPLFEENEALSGRSAKVALLVKPRKSKLMVRFAS